MTKATHTPGPLTVENLYLIADDKGIVADLDSGQYDEPTATANAHRLALCWDTHDELVAALRRCIAALAANGAPNCEAAKEARAALAMVEGETK